MLLIAESDSALQNIETREVAGNLEKNMGGKYSDINRYLNTPFFNFCIPS